MPGFSDFFDRLRELFKPSQPKTTGQHTGPTSLDPSDNARQKERGNVAELAREDPPSHPWDDPWDAARERTAENALPESSEPSDAPAPDDASQGATVPEPPPILEEPDAGGRAIPPE